MDIKEGVEKLDNLLYKYGFKDEKDILGYRANFIEYVKSLENISLETEYKKHEFLYEFIELQKRIGLDIDLLNNYTMLLSTSNRKLGQDFTPSSLLDLISKMTIDTTQKNPIFYDCAGGTGSQVMKAYYIWLNKQKYFNSQFEALLEVDEYDIYNCYCCVFNFIIRGLNAIVRNKNTLTNETYKVFIMTNKATNGEVFSWFSDYKTIEGEKMYEF